MQKSKRAFLPGGQGIPIRTRSFQQGIGPQHICLDEIFRVDNGTVHMGLRRKMQKAYRVVFREQGGDHLTIHDIPLHKHIILVALKVSQRKWIRGIRKRIQIHCTVSTATQQQSHQVRADKATSTGDENSLFSGHVYPSLVRTLRKTSSYSLTTWLISKHFAFSRLALRKEIRRSESESKPSSDVENLATSSR